MEKKRFSDENIKPPVVSNNRLFPALNCINTKPQVKWKLFKTRTSDIYSETIDEYLHCIRDKFADFTARKEFALGNSFFGAVKLTKNSNFDKNK